MVFLRVAIHTGYRLAFFCTHGDGDQARGLAFGRLVFAIRNADVTALILRIRCVGDSARFQRRHVCHQFITVSTSLLQGAFGASMQTV